MPNSRLSVGDLGEEVVHLHNRLAASGLAVAPEELKRRFFGPSTRDAVGEFQKIHGIDPSCELCDKTVSPGAEIYYRCCYARNVAISNVDCRSPAAQSSVSDGHPCQRHFVFRHAR